MKYCGKCDPSMIDVWGSYKGGLKWLPERTIVLMKHGSYAYGTNGPGSDIDIKGIAVPPKEFLLGFVERFEQADKGWDGLDCVVYDLRKLMGLAADNNPNCIELPFVDPSDWLTSTPHWEKIVEHRDLFLSQNARHRFCGYAIAQLKRIRSHREWLFDPPKALPKRADFGLPEFTSMSQDQRMAAEDQVKKQIEAWRVDLAEVDDGIRISLLNEYGDALTEIAGYSGKSIEDAAARKLGYDENFIEYLGQERGYRGAMARWKQYQDWLKNRNVARGELEAKYGYDTKHGMHLVRLMRMAKEIMRGEGVIVKRPDAEELKAIRNGAMDYEDLVEWAQHAEEDIVALVATSPLPKNPNRKKLDEVCVSICEAML